VAGVNSPGVAAHADAQEGGVQPRQHIRVVVHRLEHNLAVDVLAQHFLQPRLHRLHTRHQPLVCHPPLPMTRQQPSCGVGKGVPGGELGVDAEAPCAYSGSSTGALGAARMRSDGLLVLAVREALGHGDS
jgi:hypothetical protein